MNLFDYAEKENILVKNKINLPQELTSPFGGGYFYTCMIVFEFSYHSSYLSASAFSIYIY